jgi:tetratricopeptide (TPR) repeat protein
VHSLRRAGAAQPDLAAAWQALARVCLNLADGTTALAAADRWAALEPAAAHALGMRADALRLLKRLPEALQAARAALALAPGDARLQLAEGAALLALRQYAQAQTVLERVLEGDASNVDALAAFAAALAGNDHNERAIEVLDRVVVLDPGQVEAPHLRALALMNQCRHAEAATFLQQALRERPDDARLQFDLAAAWLTLGRWADGWRQYEWRWSQGSAGGAMAPKTGGTRWQPGQDVNGRTVLLQSEQGLGDAIQFIRYVPAVLARGARVVLQLSPRLHALLPSPWQGCRLVGQAPPPQEFELQCPLLSLPHVLGLPEPLTMDAPYVSAASHRRAHWRSRLGDAAAARVGLVWAGNPNHPDDHRRSMPLDLLRGVLQGLPGVQFVSLQMDIRDSDRDALAAWPELLHFGTEQADMADTAALVEELDAVVCVDTSLAHLTGAVGRPLWLLLPFNADWRWGLARTDTPWYPSACLLRQPQPGDWAGVLARLRRELPRCLQARP